MASSKNSFFSISRRYGENGKGKEVEREKAKPKTFSKPHVGLLADNYFLYIGIAVEVLHLLLDPIAAVGYITRKRLYGKFFWIGQTGCNHRGFAARKFGGRFFKIGLRSGFGTINAT